MTNAIAPVTKTLTNGTNEWIGIPLDTPVAYDGVSNLIIEISLSGNVNATGFKIKLANSTGFRRLYSFYGETKGSPTAQKLVVGMDIGQNDDVRLCVCRSTSLL